MTLPVTHRPIPPSAQALYKRTSSGVAAPSRVPMASDMADLSSLFLIRLPLGSCSV